MSTTRVVVVGGGISGLAAAWHLRQGDPDLDLVVLDSGDAPGGKLRRVELAGVGIDVGAEAILARRPEGTDLARAIGLVDRLTHPATMSAAIWSRGGLHPMPAGTLMGVPSNAAAVLGLLEPDEVTRAEQERERQHQPTAEDISVGRLVSDRLGPAVVQRLVEPLLGGVYAGHADQLSLQATVPQLWQAAAAGESLTVAAERAFAGSSGNPEPVFAGLVGGVSTLAEELVSSLLAQGVRVISRAVVRELGRTGVEGRPGWSLTTGPVPKPVLFEADAVVLAVPPAPAARLLAPHAPYAAAELAAVSCASVAVVSLAVTRAGLPALSGSGFLVPPVDGRAVKASTFTSNKWSWVADAAPDLFILRASLGRLGEEAVLQRSDDDLVRLVLDDLAEALGGPLPTPVECHVQRWGGALPQYAVGHVDRVARIHAGVSQLAGLALAGAAYQGLGIPACIASGRQAAEAVLTHLRAGREHG